MKPDKSARALAGVLLLAVSVGFPAPVAQVVSKALAFKAGLSSVQQAVLEQSYTAALSHRWSNLPCGADCRNGIQFSSLTSEQLAAALEVIAAAAGMGENRGFAEFQQIREADSVLGKAGGFNRYSSGLYFIAFLNTPSITGKWMLQYGGHHYGANISYNKGNVIGVTPFFQGIEPKRFTDAAGRTQSPLNQEHAALAAMLASLTAEQTAAAKLATSFSDVSRGPGQDGKFPATKAGLKAGSLTALQQALILAAMEPYLGDIDSAAAAVLRAAYGSELGETYIAFSGSAALDAIADYVRIDGPSVWIEFICQAGNVFPAQIHYHTVWRDRGRDYGHDLANASLATGAGARKKKAKFTVGYNPAGDRVGLSLYNAVSDADLTVADRSGKVVFSRSRVSGARMDLDASAFPAGVYTVKVEDKRIRLLARFAKL